MQMSLDGLMAVDMVLQEWLISRLPKMAYDLYLGFGVLAFYSRQRLGRSPWTL